MPEPLANPLIVTWTPPIEAVRLHPFGNVSVVMIALAAGAQAVSSNDPASPGRFDAMASAGIGWPMTPVEATNTSAGAHSASSAAAFTVASTKASPALPVKALELPELTTMARATPLPRLARQRWTGADAVSDRVRTPAIVVPGSRMATIRSSRPL